MLNSKEKELVSKLKKLPNSYSVNAEQTLENALIVVVLYAKQRNNIDEIIKAAASSSTLDEALSEIFKDERIEIVDDE